MIMRMMPEKNLVKLKNKDIKSCCTYTTESGVLGFVFNVECGITKRAFKAYKDVKRKNWDRLEEELSITLIDLLNNIIELERNENENTKDTITNNDTNNNISNDSGNCI